VDLTPRGPERRAWDRRSGADRRFGERRDPARASANRRVFPFDRRVAERRFLERRTDWPDEAQAY